MSQWKFLNRGNIMFSILSRCASIDSEVCNRSVLFVGTLYKMELQ